MTCDKFTSSRKNRIALARAFAQHLLMLARVFSTAVNGIEAFPVEVEVNSGWLSLSGFRMRR